MAQIIDGKALAAQYRTQMKNEIEQMKERGFVPGLTVILVGDDPASAVYVRNKERACIEVGIRSEVLRMPASTSQEELHTTIDRLNNDANVHGILLQLPLPKGLDSDAALELIDPAKDVDGLHAVNAGKLVGGGGGLVSCTPLGVIAMIKSTGVKIEGKHAVVLGRSRLVGKPVSLLLLNENATVTMCHSRTQNIKEVCSQADILVAAIGKPGFVTADMVKEGAIVIDVGTTKEGDKLTGDVVFDEVAPKASYISPVPGGVGPMTITMLLFNTLEAAKAQ